jgi:predicted DCC family thiol-disulfide oxidoreductase YuxK
VPDPVTDSIVLYDGVCGLCNRGVQFLLKRDRHDRLRFASLQSDFAVALLERHGVNASDLDTVYVVVGHEQANESLLARADAVLDLMKEIGGVWHIVRLMGILPKWVRDRIYNFVARHRYQVFGKYDSCLLPEERYRHKFLDAEVRGVVVSP